MSLKSLLFTDAAEEEKSKQNTISKTPTTKFPTEECTTSNGLFGKTNEATTTFPETHTTVQTSIASQEHLNNAIDVYKRGFESLNQPGYDFYEFFKAVAIAGPENPQVYQMAFMMGASMDATITKEKLIQQSDFYINEINKVYNDFVAKGNAKKQELEQLKLTENQSLASELEMLKQQLEALKTKVADRENKLKEIGGKYEPNIVEVNSKLAANDIAKNKIVESINQVKRGIKNNLN